MLAPKSDVFYDQQWPQLDPRSLLSKENAEASGIHPAVYTANKLDLGNQSILQHMS